MLEEKLNLQAQSLGVLEETTQGEIPASASPVLATPAAAAAFVAGACVVTGAYALGHAVG